MTRTPMTRTLILLRHGKSAYPAGVPDHDRPLAARGRREAALAGGWIAAHAPPLDRIACSTATRTRQTLECTGLDAPFVGTDERIYAADARDLLEVIAGAPAAARAFLVVGHGPGLPDLAADLAGPASEQEQLGAMMTKFPTSAVAVLEFACGWAELAPGRGRLSQFVVPRH